MHNRSEASIRMKKIILQIIIYIGLFLVSGILSISFEANYREMIRYFYEIFTLHKVSFHTPTKYIHFPSFSFVFIFSTFVLLYYPFLRIKRKQAFYFKNLLPLFISCISLLLSCYICSNTVVINCTQCIDGRIELQYEEVPYDGIFIFSLVCGILPLILTVIATVVKKRKTVLNNF